MAARSVANVVGVAQASFGMRQCVGASFRRAEHAERPKPRALARGWLDFGHFLSHPVRMPLASDSTKFAEVIKTEEKGSDVNLATHLLADGFRNEYGVAVVISNDSDLLEPIKVVRYELKKVVGVVNPQLKAPPSKPLFQHANFFRQLRRGALASSQFAPSLRDEHGTFNKPGSW